VNVNVLAERRPLLTVDEAADYLTVTAHFIRRLVRERRVPFIKLGRFVRFHPDDLDAFIDAGRRQPTRSS